MPSSNPFARFLDVATTPLVDTDPGPTPVEDPSPAPAPAAPIPDPRQFPAVTPEDAPTADPTPDPEPTRTRTTRARLTEDMVADIRRSYAYSRELARDATTADEWETVTATEARLAEEYGVSSTTVHEVVLGVRYPDAPGPIDTIRRARYERYLMERETLGERAAKARMRDLESVPPSLAVTITVPGRDPISTIYPPGTYVAVTTVGAGTQDDDADGEE